MYKGFHRCAGVREERTERTVEDKKFLTADELAARWMISARTIREMAQAGEIPATKLGRFWRFPLDRIERFERANES